MNLEKSNPNEWAHKSGKRAAAAEQREKKIETYKQIIMGMIGKVQQYPFYDYSGELEDLFNKYPADRAEILAAEREAYAEKRKPKSC